MKTERYLAYDGINGDHELFDTIEEARSHIEEIILDPDDGYHPDLELCAIYELKESVTYDVKYSEHSEDELWQHKFIPIEDEL